MLIQNPRYRRNAKTGNILKREEIDLQCDRCLVRWKTLHGNWKRKQSKKDLCASCRSRKRWETERRPRGKCLNVNCAFCSKAVRVSEYNLTPNRCCSRLCSTRLRNKIKYAKLEQLFSENKDHVAYFWGLIMGDGHIKKHANETRRISIAFDVKKPELIRLAQSVFDKLGIHWFQEPLVRKNCTYIGFVLPLNLLQSYGLDYYGDKYKSQPYPSRAVVHNINYVAGLINSDGHSSLQSNGKADIRITNTVKSIIQSITDCLDVNEIHYTRFEYALKPDKRTGRTNKNSLLVVISREKDVDRLRSLVSFKIKEVCNGL